MKKSIFVVCMFIFSLSIPAYALDGSGKIEEITNIKGSEPFYI